MDMTYGQCCFQISFYMENPVLWSFAAFACGYGGFKSNDTTSRDTPPSYTTPPITLASESAPCHLLQATVWVLCVWWKKRARMSGKETVLACVRACVRVCV